MKDAQKTEPKRKRGRPALTPEEKASRVYKYPSASVRLTGKLEGWTGAQVKAAAIWARENGFIPAD